jgi:rSAM/selenodomain-associated transferase 1
MAAPPALIVFAKEPVPGRVKTRLAAALGPERAAELYSAFVWDPCERLVAAGFQPEIAADPDPESPFFGDLAARLCLRVVPQGPGDLGDRMAAALKRHLDGGAERALLIGTDLPTLPPDHLKAAARALGPDTPLVLGPATDGGYYLVGAHRAALADWPRIAKRLFTGIPWSEGDVLHRTLTRAKGLKLALAPAWYDVDDPAGLDRLAAHLRRSAEPALPRTRDLLSRWGYL